MVGRYLILLISLVTLSGCTFSTPEIYTLCYRDDIGNYVIKWETDLPVDGIVKVYVSDDPEKFKMTNPSVYASISDGVATYITRDNITRRYFRLSFNDKYFRVLGSRGLSFDNVQNIRDLGGYETEEGKTVQWGKVFRSGDLSDLSFQDSIRLVNLDVKTIIDLRDQYEVEDAPIQYGNATIVHIPIPDNFKDLTERIRDDRMRKRDALIYMQDLYLQYVTDYSGLFAEAMELFQDENNYPILFSCTLGKDRAGFLAAMLLSALEVSVDDVIQDYTLSGDYIDFGRFAYLAEGIGQEGQEAMTVLLSSSEEFLSPTLQMVRKEYGSTGNYLTKELGLTPKKENKLREILLQQDR